MPALVTGLTQAAVGMTDRHWLLADATS